MVGVKKLVEVDMSQDATVSETLEICNKYKVQISFHTIKKIKPPPHFCIFII